MMKRYFISDLHLQPELPQLTQAFIDFVRNIACDADELYILGDFFEVWIGDDDRSAFNEQIKTELYRLSQNGVRIYFMVGNRDFLIGETFCQQANLTLITEPHLIEHNGKRIALMHGDSLCTDDIAHQRFRRITQNAVLRKLFLRLPLSVRKNIATHFRKRSQSRQKTLPTAIMDINQTSFKNAINNLQVNQIIHGHTHRKTITQQRIVLAAWHDNPEYYILGEQET